VQVRPESSLLWVRRLVGNPLGGVAVILAELESVAKS
jgi:hypothetical protein